MVIPQCGVGGEISRADVSCQSVRLCIVGPLAPPEGGMANQTLQLAQKLISQEGIPVEIVRTNAPYWPRWIERFQGFRAIARWIPYIVRLFRAYRRCDVVHIMANSGWAWHLFAAPALWVAVLCKKPAIVNYRGGDAESFLFRSRRLVGFSVRRAARLIVPSGYLQSIFANHLMHADVIPNIVDLTRFKPGEQGLCSTKIPHLVVTRNLEPIYDNETAIRALALLRERGFAPIRLTIAGTGPLLHALKELTEELGLIDAVNFVGRLNRDQVVALYQSADIAINPSLVDNMPNSVLEALACGVPVVSTNVGGVPHVVKQGDTAILVPARDHEAMCQAIATILQDRNLATRLSIQGLAHVQQFGWKIVAPKWIEAYQQLAQHPAGTKRYS